MLISILRTIMCRHPSIIDYELTWGEEQFISQLDKIIVWVYT